MFFKSLIKNDNVTPTKEYLILEKTIKKIIGDIYDTNNNVSPRDLTALLHSIVSSVGMSKTLLAAIKIKAKEKTNDAHQEKD